MTRPAPDLVRRGRAESHVIAIDARNGERAPEAPVQAAAQAARDGIAIALLGDAKALRALVAQHGGRRKAQIEVIESTTPIRDAMRRVAAGDAKAAISGAETSAIVAEADNGIGLLPGVCAPAVAGVFATVAAPVVVLDLGGSGALVTPAATVQRAVMGAAYAATLLSRSAPRVGLLSPGRDDPPETLRAVDAALRQCPVDYRGPIPGTAVFTGEIDVVLTDGVTGRNLMETIEGLGAGIETLIREHVRGSLLVGAGALLMSRLGRSLEQKLDHPGFGAGAIIGIDGLCFSVHHRSGTKMWRGAIQTADAAARAGVLDSVRRRLAAV